MEIMDHIVMGVTFEECNRQKLEYLTNGRTSAVLNSKFKKDFNIEWDDPLHRNNSWAGQLAKLLNLKFENRAMNGTGLDEQYLKIYNDYNQGLILEDDLVLIGLTSLDRMIDFRSKEKITTLMSRNIPNETSSKLLLDIANDDYLVFQYFKTLILLNSFNSKMQLKMQPMTIPILDNCLTHLNNPHTKQFAKDVWNSIVDNVLLPGEFLKRPEVNGVQIECGFHHPPLESHTELAEKIYNQIKF
jgi:hypothetical protein